MFIIFLIFILYIYIIVFVYVLIGSVSDGNLCNDFRETCTGISFVFIFFHAYSMPNARYTTYCKDTTFFTF
jgi:hypothetical protein